jgi:hypothetical protein
MGKDETDWSKGKGLNRTKSISIVSNFRTRYHLGNRFCLIRYPAHIHVILSAGGSWTRVTHDTLMHGLRLWDAKGGAHHAHLHLHLQHGGGHRGCHARCHCAIQRGWISHVRHGKHRLLLLWVRGLGLGCRGIRPTARHGWLLSLHLLHGLQLFKISALAST